MKTFNSNDIKPNIRNTQRFGESPQKLKENEEALDTDAVRELFLYTTNDGDLYRQRAQPMIVNLARKKNKEVFDPELAVKMFMYLADAGAQKYGKEHLSKEDKWNDVFPKAVRLKVAKEFVDHYMEEINEKAESLKNKKKENEDPFAFQKDHLIREDFPELGVYVEFEDSDGIVRVNDIQSDKVLWSPAQHHIEEAVENGEIIWLDSKSVIKYLEDLNFDFPKKSYREKKWSGDVDEKWHPPEGFFTKSQDEIAHGLKNASSDLKQAMSRLNFYVNRAGHNLDAKERERLEGVKNKLHNLYESILQEDTYDSFLESAWKPHVDKLKENLEHNIKALTEIKGKEISGNDLMIYKRMLEKAMKDIHEIESDLKSLYPRLEKKLTQKQEFVAQGYRKDSENSGIELQLSETDSISYRFISNGVPTVILESVLEYDGDLAFFEDISGDRHFLQDFEDLNG